MGVVFEVSVKIKGLWYSVFIPALGSDNPSKNFVHAFLHVAQEELKVVGFDGDCHNACLDSFSIFQHDISPPSHDSELKLEVDALLILENMQIGSKNVGVIKEMMLENPERLQGSVGLSGIASALSFANEIRINGGSSLYVDGDEGSSCDKGNGTILDSVGVVGEVSILSPNSIMSNVVPKSSVRRLAKKNQCPLLNHLGFNRSMEKENGIQVSKRRCSVSYPNG
uniref:Fgenesh protein 20 n=1 Tax=Beta vulgaris TaxID=161934 RepID=Q20CE6_BETVU|nr:Fgenesh protein 20 [Beta vulgaris]